MQQSAFMHSLGLKPTDSSRFAQVLCGKELLVALHCSPRRDMIVRDDGALLEYVGGSGQPTAAGGVFTCMEVSMLLKVCICIYIYISAHVYVITDLGRAHPGRRTYCLFRAS